VTTLQSLSFRLVRILLIPSHGVTQFIVYICDFISYGLRLRFCRGISNCIWIRVQFGKIMHEWVFQRWWSLWNSRVFFFLIGGETILLYLLIIHKKKIMQNQINCHLHAKNTCEINKLLISVIWMIQPNIISKFCISFLAVYFDKITLLIEKFFMYIITRL
jgi:hypothetical protein